MDSFGRNRGFSTGYNESKRNFPLFARRLQIHCRSNPAVSRPDRLLAPLFSARGPGCFDSDIKSHDTIVSCLAQENVRLKLYGQIEKVELQARASFLCRSGWRGPQRASRSPNRVSSQPLQRVGKVQTRFSIVCASEQGPLLADVADDQMAASVARPPGERQVAAPLGAGWRVRGAVG